MSTSSSLMEGSRSREFPKRPEKVGFIGLVMRLGNERQPQIQEATRTLSNRAIGTQEPDGAGDCNGLGLIKGAIAEGAGIASKI